MTTFQVLWKSFSNHFRNPFGNEVGILFHVAKNYFAIVLGIIQGIKLVLHPMSYGNHFGRTIETTLHVLRKSFRYHFRNHFGNKAGITPHALRKSLWSHVGKHFQILFRASLGMTLTKFEYPVENRLSYLFAKLLETHLKMAAARRILELGSTRRAGSSARVFAATRTRRPATTCRRSCACAARRRHRVAWRRGGGARGAAAAARQRRRGATGG